MYTMYKVWHAVKRGEKHTENSSRNAETYGEQSGTDVWRVKPHTVPGASTKQSVKRTMRN